MLLRQSPHLRPARPAAGIFAHDDSIAGLDVEVEGSLARLRATGGELGSGGSHGGPQTAQGIVHLAPHGGDLRAQGGIAVAKRGSGLFAVMTPVGGSRPFRLRQGFAGQVA